MKRKPSVLRHARTFLMLLVLLGGAVPSAHALVFNVIYDTTTSNAPAAFFTAFQDAINFFQQSYTDPITINIQVGWGKINGQSLAPGDIGQSSTFQQGFYTYDQIRTALINDATSADDATALANLPATDPTGGASFVMANAEAKALGLLAGNASGLDGYVGFSTNVGYSFDPNDRAVPGKFDFIGLASHEISEVMGRYGLGQNGAASGRYSPIDLFRYSPSGGLDLVPEDGAYFSINGGFTEINVFNGTGGGDLSDWAGNTIDPFNVDLTLDAQENVSAGDLVEMDVIGYDRAAPPPLLRITPPVSGHATVSWSSLLTVFKLQTNSVLGSTDWSAATYTISTNNGTNFTATISPPPPGNLFFRLQH
jgi:hypothetical protein